MALANAAMLIYLLWPAKIIEGMVRRPPQRESLLPDTGWMKDLAWCVINLTSAAGVLLAYTTTNHKRRAGCKYFSLWNTVYYSKY